MWVLLGNIVTSIKSSAIPFIVPEVILQTGAHLPVFPDVIKNRKGGYYTVTDLPLACCRYLISQHPEVEERILQELAQHELMPGPHGAGRAIRLEDLSRLTYLNCVIKVRPLVGHLQC